MVLRGSVEATMGKGARALPPFSGDKPIVVAGATMLPQSLWVAATTLVVVAALALFFERTRLGKGILATAHNRLAAQLVGVDTRRVLTLSFGLSTWHGPEDSPSELLRRADAALYEAKLHGRDRLMVWAPRTHSPQRLAGVAEQKKDAPRDVDQLSG